MYELQDSRLHTISYGPREQIFAAVKYHVIDGRYRIIGPELQLYCIRRQGHVYPDPDRVPLQRRTSPQMPALQYFA